MASVLFIVFMVARTALVLFLPSLAMTAVTGINIYICIALMALITILYCTMGGVEAVVWGDVIQGIILVGGAILAAVYLIVNTGEHGASDFWQIATDHDKFRLFLFDPEHPFDFVNATWWVVILGGLANNLISYTSDQTVIQRYLTTSDEKSAARGILTNGLMSVVVTIAFFTIGTGLYTFFQTHPAELDITMAKSDAIFPFFMMSQLPAGLAGLLIAAVFAATMSTIASNINSISTAFTVDLWGKVHSRSLPKGGASDSLTTSGNESPSLGEAIGVGQASTVKVARIAGICAGLLGMAIACLMATVDIQSLLDYFNTILGLLSGAIGGHLLPAHRLACSPHRLLLRHSLRLLPELLHTSQLPPLRLRVHRRQRPRRPRPQHLLAAEGRTAGAHLADSGKPPPHLPQRGGIRFLFINHTYLNI